MSGDSDLIILSSDDDDDLEIESNDRVDANNAPDGSLVRAPTTGSGDDNSAPDDNLRADTTGSGDNNAAPDDNVRDETAGLGDDNTAVDNNNNMIEVGTDVVGTSTNTADGVPYYVTRTIASQRAMTASGRKWIGRLAEKKRLEMEKLKKTKKSQTGYLAVVSRYIYKAELGNVAHNDQALKNTNNFIRRCHKKTTKGKYDVIDPKRRRIAGGGRKKRVTSVRAALFDWFVDIRCSLKGRLTLQLLQKKAEQLYEAYLKKAADLGFEPEVVKFTRHWALDWCKEYKISRKKPSKRFKLKYEIRKRRIVQFLKNMWRVRLFMVRKFKTEPVIWSADQMPLHRNESSGSTTESFAGMDAIVKENHTLSRERVTVFTQVSSCPTKPPPPYDFLFRGVGTRTTVSVPDRSNYTVQWGPKGSYRLANMKEWVARLPQILPVFPQKTQVITLDNYSVHLDPSLQQDLRRKGYILVLIGGGMTGDIQVNDTHLHRNLKSEYREEEAKLNIRKLNSHPENVPTPTRSEMMGMLHCAQQRDTDGEDQSKAFKTNFITTAFDGSENTLVSRSLFQLVGKEMLEFRENLLNSVTPSSFSDLFKTISKPEGVGMSELGGEDHEMSADEGMELLDGEITSEDESESDSDSDSESSDCDSDEIDAPNSPINIPAPVEAPAPMDVSGDNASDENLVESFNEASVIREFEDMSARRSAEAPAQMGPFFERLNSFLKAELKKVRVPAVIDARLNFDNVPFLPDDENRPDPDVPSTSGVRAPQTQNGAGRKKLCVKIGSCWNGIEVWVFWPANMGQWSYKFWKAIVSNDIGDTVTLKYSGEWELPNTRERGQICVANSELEETKHNLLEKWLVEVASNFSL